MSARGLARRALPLSISAWIAFVSVRAFAQEGSEVQPSPTPPSDVPASDAPPSDAPASDAPAGESACEGNACVRRLCAPRGYCGQECRPYSFWAEDVDTDEDGVPRCAGAHEPGYFPGVGSPYRDLGATLDVAVGRNEIFAFRISARAMVLQIDPQLLFLGITVPFLVSGDRTLIPSPVPEVGTVIRSMCDRFRLMLSAQLLPPSFFDPQPSDIEAAVVAMLTSGAEDGSLWLPRSDVGFRVRIDARYRTQMIANFFLVSLGMRIALGSARIATWLGPQQTLLGSVAVDFGLVLSKINARVAARGAVGVGAAFSAGQVAPFTLEIAAGWGPFREFDMEIFVGYGDFLLDEVTDASTIRSGLRLTAYVDYAPIPLGDLNETPAPCPRRPARDRDRAEGCRPVLADHVGEDGPAAAPPPSPPPRALPPRPPPPPPGADDAPDAPSELEAAAPDPGSPPAAEPTSVVHAEPDAGTVEP